MCRQQPLPPWLQKPGRAVGIRFSRRIISMGADINIRLFLFINAGCQTCRYRNHEAVPKRNIRRYLSCPLFRNLLTVTFVYNTLRRMGQKRTIGILHDLRQIKFIMRHMVIRRHRSCGIQLPFMLLSIKIEAVLTFSAPSAFTATERQVVESTPPLDNIIAFFIFPPVFYSWCSEWTTAETNFRFVY